MVEGARRLNKAYSNKALPAGTVLREWRLEEVLGVGGFGIVYKAHGIYFDELVAIKEYFPSSTSERDSDDTVVPIDSNAEEVHALGLKKFVEEAKLLWNLSTPSRHPNIVSVRSLFEIHGTAYMVMDFEDGVSLSKMLKQGRRFNERSLWNILRPIAEGLERAHRVGVLHRDIKPPNILITEDNRPVLIDFGSARFEAAEATSTKVTFHTPPYAAIEQYVKTYEQGPWTDIYALGVVMYECVTGEKPPEVLERLHAGLGKPLSEGKWPGYSKRFLSAIDAAMTVKPDERPQAIDDWLAMFGRQSDQEADDDDEATRFFPKQVEAQAIMPVPATPNVDRKTAVKTGVPDDPKKASFTGAGQQTAKRKKAASEQEALTDSNKATKKKAGGGAAAAAIAPAVAAGDDKIAAGASRAMPSRPVMAGIAIAVLALASVAALTLRGAGSGPTEVAQLDSPSAGTIDNALGNALGNEGEVVLPAAEEAAPGAATETDEAVRREAARAAAAEARLAEVERRAARSAQPLAGGRPATAAAAVPAARVETESASSDSGGVSPAKLSQFYSIVDDARSMARRVISSGNRDNAQLARNYDANLKTLRDSMRGVQSDREADRLIKQANQTRAYVQFLDRQRQ